MIKALLVDDDPLVIKGLNILLPWKKYGIKVIGNARNGRKALDFILENNVDLVFTDISMPEMNGLDLMREMAKNHPDISFVVLTCYEEFNYVQKAIQLGAVDYILKTQLENDKVDRVLASITERLYSKMKTSKLNSVSEGLLYITPNHSVNMEIFKELQLQSIIPISPNASFIPSLSMLDGILKITEEQKNANKEKDFFIVKVYNLEGYTREL